MLVISPRAEGITPLTRAYAGECGSPLAFVLAMNLQRRHLSEGQRAAVGVEALPFFEVEAKARQREAAERTNTIRYGDAPLTDASLGADLHHATERAPRAADKAGASVGVSGRAIAQAKRIQSHEPDLFEEVRAAC